MKELDNKLKRKIGALVVMGIFLTLLVSTSVPAGGPTDPWLMEGNSGVDSGDYIGTDNTEDLRFYTDATQKMVIETSGEVGIGQSTPLSILHLKDDDPAIIFEPEDQTGDTDFWMGVIEDAGNDDDDIFQIGDGTTVGTNPFVTLDTNGNVGIGDTTPSHKLEIVDTDNTIGRAGLRVAHSGTGQGYGIIALKTGAATTNTGGYFIANEATTNYGVLSLVESGVGSPTTNIGGYFSATSATNNYGLLVANGDVGIGTTTPIRKLEVVDTSAQLRLSYSAATTFTDFSVDTNHDLLIKPSSTGQIKLQPSLDSTDFFQVLDADGGTPIMNVDATNEKVGIGTATPSAKLDVEVSSGGAATIGSSTASAAGGYAVALNDATASGSSSFAIHTGVSSGTYSFATGLGSESSGYGSIATGVLSKASDLYAIALGGFVASASGEYSVAIGSEITASGDNSIAIGNCISDSDLDNNIADSLMIGFNSAATVYVDGSSVGIKDTTPDALLDYDLISTSTTAATEYGSYFKTSDTGAVTSGSDITYGTMNEIIRTGTTGGTHSTYGEYIDVTHTGAFGSDSTLNTYGEYIDLTTSLYGASTAYGLYVNLDGNADTNYAGIFMGGNVGIGTTTPSTSLHVDGDVAFGDGSEVTISSGSITVTDAYHTVDTESDSSSDDLDSISGGSTAGEILIIQAENDGRTVVVKDGAGIKLNGDFSLDSVEDTIALLYTGSTWIELFRSDNGA